MVFYRQGLLYFQLNSLSEKNTTFLIEVYKLYYERIKLMKKENKNEVTKVETKAEKKSKKKSK